MSAKNSTKSVRSIAVEILDGVFSNGSYVDEALASAIDHSNLSQRDRSLLVEMVNGTVRWRGQIDWILEQLFRGDFSVSPLRLRIILELSLYQIRFLEKVPSYAAVSEGVEIAKRQGGRPWGNLVNGVLRNYLRASDRVWSPPVGAGTASALAIRHSHPQWMIERWLKRFGLEKMERLCEYNNRRPLISIRANRMKTTREFLLNQFEKDGIQATPSTYFDDFILLHQPENLAQSPLFRDGFFAIQDESTAIPCILLSPQKGEVILDLCAAPGGKTCYLAQIAEDESNIIAVDQNPKRLERLQQNIKRLRLKSIRTVVGDGTRFNLRPIDKILLDAPCSGLGVLARRADLRWKRSLHDICKIQELQKSLLASADKMLKPGGTLVYSTCTIEPEENEIVIDDFVSSNKNYVIETTDTKIAETFATKEGFFKSLPQDHNMDGSFAVKLIKKS